MCQEKSFSDETAVEQTASTSTQFHVQTDENLSVLINKQNINHNIIQSLVIQEGISPQDLIVLVELKSKDYSPTNNLYVASKKPEVIQTDTNENFIKMPLIDELTNISNKSMDTNSNVKVISLYDLDGKLDQFSKIAPLFVSENTLLDKNISGKAFTPDLFNVLKLDNLNANNITALNTSSKLDQKATTPNFEGLPLNVSSNVTNVTVKESLR